jgi:hypothetical protein
MPQLDLFNSVQGHVMQHDAVIKWSHVVWVLFCCLFLQGAFLIAAEDKAFVDLDKERDILALQNEGHSFSAGPRVTGIVNAGALPLGAMTIGGCMKSFDDLLMEVEVHLKCNDGRNRPLQILKAVNTVLFKKKGFIRSNPFGNPQSSYLDQIFIRGSGTGVSLPPLLSLVLFCAIV